MGALQGKVAIVTGAARGLGRGIALGLADAGADVVLADLGQEASDHTTYAMSSGGELESTVAEVQAKGVRALGVTCDVTSAADAQKVVAETKASFGHVDALVNNAGVVHFAPMAEFEEDKWDHLFDVNVKGTFLCCKAAIPELLESQGAIVNVASVAGKRGYAGGSGYCGSKFAVVGLTQSLAAELGPRGVRVNAVCPGIIATHMWTHHLASEERGGKAAYEGAVQTSIPLGREQTADDIAGGVLYLLTAPNVSGVSLNVAGGMEVW